MRRCLALGLFCGVGAAVTFTLGAILIALPRMFEVQQSLLQEQTPQAHYTTPAMLYSEQGGLPLSGLSRELSRALGLGDARCSRSEDGVLVADINTGGTGVRTLANRPRLHHAVDWRSIAMPNVYLCSMRR